MTTLFPFCSFSYVPPIVKLSFFLFVQYCRRRKCSRLPLPGRGGTDQPLFPSFRPLDGLISVPYTRSLRSPASPRIMVESFPFVTLWLSFSSGPAFLELIVSHAKPIFAGNEKGTGWKVVFLLFGCKKPSSSLRHPYPPLKPISDRART